MQHVTLCEPLASSRGVTVHSTDCKGCADGNRTLGLWSGDQDSAPPKDARSCLRNRGRSGALPGRRGHVAAHRQFPSPARGLHRPHSESPPGSHTTPKDHKQTPRPHPTYKTKLLHYLERGAIPLRCSLKRWNLLGYRQISLILSGATWPFPAASPKGASTVSPVSELPQPASGGCCVTCTLSSPSVQSSCLWSRPHPSNYLC